MKLSEMQRPYDLIMSLGYNCMVAYQLKRLSLRSFSGPVDWVINYPDQLIRILDNRFEGYMEERNLRIMSTHNGYYSVEDMEHHVYSFHDFPIVGDHWAIVNYPEFKEKLDRRVNKFLHLANQSNTALFVRERCSYEEAILLRESLSRLVKGTVHLLIINYTEEAKVVEKDWGIDGICSVEIIQSTTHEEVRDPYWNELFQGVSLIPM
jgi:hypothetical protein